MRAILVWREHGETVRFKRFRTKRLAVLAAKEAKRGFLDMNYDVVGDIQKDSFYWAFLPGKWGREEESVQIYTPDDLYYETVQYLKGVRDATTQDDEMFCMDCGSDDEVTEVEDMLWLCYGCRQDYWLVH